jgi:hypothetical protein
MIVHQHVHLAEALKSTRTATEALEALEELTTMQQLSDSLRKERLDHQRMSWEDHANQLLHEGLFVNEYTMSYAAHLELVDILRPRLQRKDYNSR